MKYSMKKNISFCVSGVLAFGLASLMGGVAAQAETISADVWADNWFALYVGEKLAKEDHVSINTERSFNKESFSFSVERPFVLNFIAKDFKENDTGLEYIGSNRQQMGDGGLIAQFVSGNNVVAATSSDWRCMVVHEAPSDKSCAKERSPVAGKGACGFTKTSEPAGWKTLGFDDSGWSHASEYSSAQVGPKDGYNEVRWSSSAKLIWGPDLETSNTILCRFVVK